MELQRTQILLEKSQHEILSQIAQKESRSLSEIVREMIDRELQADFLTDPALTEFTALDSDDFLIEDDEDEKR